jgi:hypothetical protein
VRLASPSLLKLRAEGDDQQERQSPNSIDRQIHQFTRGRVDPMRILENHQDRAAPRHRFELVQQRFEQHFAFALQAEVEIGGGIR